MNSQNEEALILQIKKVATKNNYLRCRADGNSRNALPAFEGDHHNQCPSTRTGVYMPSVGIVVRRKDDSRVEAIWTSGGLQLI
jgi:hypothetical protein